VIGDEPLYPKHSIFGSLVPILLHAWGSCYWLFFFSHGAALLLGCSNYIMNYLIIKTDFNQ